MSPGDNYDLHPRNTSQINETPLGQQFFVHLPQSFVRDTIFATSQQKMAAYVLQAHSHINQNYTLIMINEVNNLPSFVMALSGVDGLGAIQVLHIGVVNRYVNR